MDIHQKLEFGQNDMRVLALAIVSPPVIASVSEATQGSVPRTLGCFADARNDGATVSGETMAKAKTRMSFRPNIIGA